MTCLKYVSFDLLPQSGHLVRFTCLPSLDVAEPSSLYIYVAVALESDTSNLRTNILSFSIAVSPDVEHIVSACLITDVVSDGFLIVCHLRPDR